MHSHWGVLSGARIGCEGAEGARMDQAPSRRSLAPGSIDPARLRRSMLRNMVSRTIAAASAAQGEQGRVREQGGAWRRCAAVCDRQRRTLRISPAAAPFPPSRSWNIMPCARSRQHMLPVALRWRAPPALHVGAAVRFRLTLHRGGARAAACTPNSMRISPTKQKVRTPRRPRAAARTCLPSAHRMTTHHPFLPPRNRPSHGYKLAWSAVYEMVHATCAKKSEWEG